MDLGWVCSGSGVGLQWSWGLQGSLPLTKARIFSLLLSHPSPLWTGVMAALAQCWGQSQCGAEEVTVSDLSGTARRPWFVITEDRGKCCD